MVPIDSMSGNISGRQNLDYGGARAYSIPDGSRVSADNYQPRVIAKVLRPSRPNRVLYFQVRTRTTVNMTDAMRHALAVQGGAGALFGSLIRNKTAAIYGQCVAATPKGCTLRQFVFPLLRAGLSAKSAQITIAGNISIINPWVSSDTPNVPVSQAVLDKFSSELSNS